MAGTQEIVQYSYYLFSSRAEDDAVIFLYDGAAEVIAEVLFVADGKDPPPARRTNGRHTLYYRRAQFAEVIDLLRNEGPVYLIWNGERNTTLSTGYEPIGEGEQP